MRTLFTWLLLLLTCTVGTCASLGNPGVMARTSKATGGSAPDAPTNPGIDYNANPPNFTITWTDSSGGAPTGYEVWRSQDGSGFGIISGGIGTGVQEYLDDGQGGEAPFVGDGFIWKWEVRATNAFGASAFTASRTNDVFVDVVYYNANEQAAGSDKTATVDTAGFGALTEQGGTVTSTTGIKNNCCAFTSAAGHYLATANASGNGIFDNPHTLVFWIYATSLPLTSTDIITRDGGDSFVVLDSGGTISWYAGGGWTPSTASLGSLNAWHCVVAYYSSISDAKISIDGATYSASGSVGCGDNPGGDSALNICPPFGGLLTLNGRVDEPAIWPRALSQAEATSIAGGRFK